MVKIKLKSRSVLEKLANPKRTQVILENLVLSDLIDRRTLGFLKERMYEFGKPVVSSIQLYFVSEKKDNVQKKERIESLLIEQPSPIHLNAKKVIITSSHSKLIDNILK